MKAGALLFLSGQYSDFRTPDCPFLQAGFGVTGPDWYHREANVTTGRLRPLVAHYYSLVHSFFRTVQSLFSNAVWMFSCTCIRTIIPVGSPCSHGDVHCSGSWPVTTLDDANPPAKQIRLTQMWRSGWWPEYLQPSSANKQAGARRCCICEEPNFKWGRDPGVYLPLVVIVIFLFCFFRKKTWECYWFNLNVCNPQTSDLEPLIIFFPRYKSGSQIFTD